MNASKSNDSVVLEEEIDPNYVPLDHEGFDTLQPQNIVFNDFLVSEYAKWLGIDLDIDPDLVWIAREGLMVTTLYSLEIKCNCL